MKLLLMTDSKQSPNDRLFCVSQSSHFLERQWLRHNGSDVQQLDLRHGNSSLAIKN